MVVCSGVIPKELNTAIIRPLYKKGKKNVCTNYRAISILPLVAKKLEKYVARVAMKFLLTHNLFKPTQYGCMEGISTTNALEDFNDIVSAALDEGKIAIAMCLDLTKAFDTVNHSILLHKLENLGFRGPFLSFFTNYLSERQQTASVCGFRSTITGVNRGVPQGSVLGPLLLNDMR